MNSSLTNTIYYLLIKPSTFIGVLSLKRITYDSCAIVQLYLQVVVGVGTEVDRQELLSIVNFRNDYYFSPIPEVLRDFNGPVVTSTCRDPSEYS